MSYSNLVIVESPAKAKTINKYLGQDYFVLASFGHVRDLVGKDGSVLPDDDFAMKWEISTGSTKAISDIKKAAKTADNIWLATDPDREGEAISWHVQDILSDDKAFSGKNFHRVAFNEITKKAVQQAFEENRKLDQRLVEAYFARRALDYLFGFNLSPVLWRKLPGSKSAGRVQSVALRLICDRESEIEAFNPQEYWSIEAKMLSIEGKEFSARLTNFEGEKLGKLDVKDEKHALRAVEAIEKSSLKIDQVEKKQTKRNPYAPFITSTLQMDASRRLGFAASRTMRVAQRLYEGVEFKGETTGLITYMRTDGTTLSGDAISQCRNFISSKYGDKYLPASPRIFKSKVKNAQEAHEAIRPTDMSRTPQDVRSMVEPEMADLYELIWKRTLASQMESAVLDQIAANIKGSEGGVVMRATGSTIAFDGFMSVYQESIDDDDEKEENRILPPLKEGDSTTAKEVIPNQHFTQPPPRYSEATLVKKLEELGIGRPSTYASILQVLRDRSYVFMEKKRFKPENRGRIVTTFLTKFFPRYVDYSFTANLENELDAISNGDFAWKEALRVFWKDFKSAIDETKELTITQVIDFLDAELTPHFLTPKDDGSDPRKCPACENGKLSLKLGKYGAFLGCSDYPDCRYTRPLSGEDDGTDNGKVAVNAEPVVLGNDPQTQRTISLRTGPYGPYVQIDPPPEGEAEEKKTKSGKKAKAPKPKRQGLPKGMSMEEVNLDVALELLSLPREVGLHPETGEKIEAGIGRFGPYLKYQGKFKSLPKDDDVLSVGINRAVEVLAMPSKSRAKTSSKSNSKSKTKTATKKTKTTNKTTKKK